MSFSLNGCMKSEELEVEMVIKDHKFVPSNIHVPSNKLIKLRITNLDNEIEEFESIDLAREKIISPGQTVTLVIAPLRSGQYKFVGEFHQETAKGMIISE